MPITPDLFDPPPAPPRDDDESVLLHESAARDYLEYAVAVLGVPLIVVLAHDSCGAVRAAIDGTAIDAEFREISSHDGNHQAAWESVPEIVIDTTPIIKTIEPKAPPAKPQTDTEPAKNSLWSRLFS